MSIWSPPRLAKFADGLTVHTRTQDGAGPVPLGSQYIGDRWGRVGLVSHPAARPVRLAAPPTAHSRRRRQPAAVPTQSPTGNGHTTAVTLQTTSGHTADLTRSDPLPAHSGTDPATAALTRPEAGLTRPDPLAV